MKLTNFTFKALSILAIGVIGTLNTADAQTLTKRHDFVALPTSTYEPLSVAATVLPFPTDWDDEVSDPITMPFVFKYQNTIVASVEIETYGSLFLNDNQSLEVGNITGLYMDYESKDRGQVLYETVGTTPSRIFKVEYRNVGRYADTNNLDTLNFQVWLYEGSNAIEYRTGFSNVPDSAFAKTAVDLIAEKDLLLTGLIENEGNSITEVQDSAYFHTLKYDGATLVDTLLPLEPVISGSASTSEALLGNFPTFGSIFRFIPIAPPTGIKPLSVLSYSVSPNPSRTGIFTIAFDQKLDNGQITIYNIAGQQVSIQIINGSSANIDLSQLSSGQYIAHVSSKTLSGTINLIKN